MKRETAAAITAGGMKKGDVLGIARIAGIAAAKKTCDLIPLAHPIALSSAAVDFVVDGERGTVAVTSTVKAFDRTGVEMEAMVSASVAALTTTTCARGRTGGSRSGTSSCSRRRAARAALIGEGGLKSHRSGAKVTAPRIFSRKC